MNITSIPQLTEQIARTFSDLEAQKLEVAVLKEQLRTSNAVIRQMGDKIEQLRGEQKRLIQQLEKTGSSAWARARKILATHDLPTSDDIGHDANRIALDHLERLLKEDQDRKANGDREVKTKQARTDSWNRAKRILMNNGLLTADLVGTNPLRIALNHLERLLKENGELKKLWENHVSAEFKLDDIKGAYIDLLTVTTNDITKLGDASLRFADRVATILPQPQLPAPIKQVPASDRIFGQPIHSADMVITVNFKEGKPAFKLLKSRHSNPNREIRSTDEIQQLIDETQALLTPKEIVWADVEGGGQIAHHNGQSLWKPRGTDCVLVTHSPLKCVGTSCAVHAPSRHGMRNWPQRYREDRGITERMCPHGIGHPDPDDITTDTSHGCCRESCCIR